MSVSMAVKTQPPGLPHAMDAELEGLWPCMISISGQWFIISTANPFQRAFCLCELQKMGKGTMLDRGKEGGRLGSEGDQRRSLFKRGLARLELGKKTQKKKLTATQAVGKIKRINSINVRLDTAALSGRRR